MHTITYEGIDPAELKRVLESGVDHGGNPIEPYIDEGLPKAAAVYRGPPRVTN